MHGYFIDMRLYRKAKSIVEPLSVTRLKQNKVKETIDQQRTSRVKVQVVNERKEMSNYVIWII